MNDRIKKKKQNKQNVKNEIIFCHKELPTRTRLFGEISFLSEESIEYLLKFTHKILIQIDRAKTMKQIDRLWDKCLFNIHYLCDSAR